MRVEDSAAHFDAGASELGRLAQRLDGTSTAAEDAAGRARVSVALDARRSARSRWLPVLAAAVVLGAGAAFLLLRAPERIAYRVSGSALEIHGEWLGVAADRGAGLLRFSEGTQIELGPGSRSRVAELTPHGAHVVLGSGGLRARVVHRPHTRWRIGAGPYSIDVTGTEFDVDWATQGGRLEVRLHDGSVVVRGPALHEGIRVAAGQRLVAHAQTGNAELSGLNDPPVSELAPAKTQERPQSSVPQHVAPSWSELLASGNFGGVLAAAQARGLDATLRRGSLADLVAFSDAARYGGDHALARRGLLAQRLRFAASAEAHAAAFLLGRMADDAGAREDALRWYDTYLRESPRGAFAAEALGRKLVATVRAGDAETSRAVAAQYLKRFAHGAHAAYAREVLQRP
ncbi:MAG: FecR domain-containing protein [Polyangiales bacterium]